MDIATMVRCTKVLVNGPKLAQVPEVVERINRVIPGIKDIMTPTEVEAILQTVAIINEGGNTEEVMVHLNTMVMVLLFRNELEKKEVNPDA